MAMGILTLAWVLLGANPAPVKEYHINQQQIRIPISIDSPAQRAQIRELILFVSSDEGKTWSQQAVASPDQEAFPFYAPKDGTYWFSVCVVNQQGRREPEDVYKVPPSQKIVIDTLKPLVRIKSADRQGDDLVVNWEIQDDHPDLATLKLEYKPADMPSYQWLPAPIRPEAVGQGRFRVANPGPISLRIQIQDLAGNAGVGSFEVPAAAGVGTTQLASAQMPAPSPSAPAGPAPSPSPPTGSSWDVPGPGLQQTSAGRVEPKLPLDPGGAARVEPRPSLEQGAPLPPPVLARSEAKGPTEALTPPPPVNNFQMPSLPGNDVKPGLVAISGKNPPSTGPAFQQTSPKAMNRPLPPLEVINHKQLAIDFEVTKQGPSGIGKAELWVTRDDGQTWDRFVESTEPKSPLRVELPGEGTYGFLLTLQSKAGRYNAPPVAGDVPQKRIELDMTPPLIKLFEPVPDPKQADALILSWKVTDRNLAPNPITLQWAERPGGSWQPIVADGSNDGQFIWKLPPNIPFMIYMRLIAKDTAGNVSTAETPTPICIDLKEPEGRLLGISGVARRP